MITKEQAVGLCRGDELHFGECKKEIGPRGGVQLSVCRVRVNGQVKTWVKSPSRFRIPIKHGLYEYGQVDEYNCQKFHLAKDCPVK